jgi:hypothetical protein
MLFEQEVTERIEDLDVSPFPSVPSFSNSLFSTLPVGLLAPPRLCVRYFFVRSIIRFFTTQFLAHYLCISSPMMATRKTVAICTRSSAKLAQSSVRTCESGPSGIT